MKNFALKLVNSKVHVAGDAILTLEEAVELARDLRRLILTISPGRARYGLVAGSCSQCGSEFTGRSGARFCSQRCAADFKKAKVRESRIALGSKSEGLIALPHGLFARVSSADWEWVSQHNWYAAKSVDGHTYAQTSLRVEGHKKRVTLHRFIMGLTEDDKIWVDHIDGDGFNNTRSNLRLATPTQNCVNKRVTANQKNGRYKGVRVSPSGSWIAMARVPRGALGPKSVHLGTYGTPEEAARSADAAAVHFYGSSAVPNFNDGIQLGPHRWHRNTTVQEAVPV